MIMLDDNSKRRHISMVKNTKDLKDCKLQLQRKALHAREGKKKVRMRLALKNNLPTDRHINAGEGGDLGSHTSLQL